MTTSSPQVPDPDDVAGYSPQQVSTPPQVEYTSAEAIQSDMQQSWGQIPVETKVQAGFPQLGSGVCGPAVPARRRTSYKLAAVLLAVGLSLAVSPFLVEGLIGFVPGNHGDGGDNLLWLAVIMLFYFAPLGIILILVSEIVVTVVALMDLSSRN